MHYTTTAVPPKVLVLCAWCGRANIGGRWVTPRLPTHFKEMVSHGICPMCAKKVAADLKEKSGE